MIHAGPLGGFRRGMAAKNAKKHENQAAARRSFHRFLFRAFLGSSWPTPRLHSRQEAVNFFPWCKTRLDRFCKGLPNQQLRIWPHGVLHHPPPHKWGAWLRNPMRRRGRPRIHPDAGDFADGDTCHRAHLSRSRLQLFCKLSKNCDGLTPARRDGASPWEAPPRYVSIVYIRQAPTSPFVIFS